MPLPTLFRHRKFLKLIKRLNEPAPHVLGYLEFLWNAGYQDGNPKIGDSEDVALAAEYHGDHQAFTNALCECGFIDEYETGLYQIHDLEENAPKYVRDRLEKRRQRDEQRRDMSPNVSDNLRQPPTCFEKSTPNRPDQTSTEQEEEEKQKLIASVSPETPQSASSGEHESDPVILTFPTDGKTKAWNLHADKLSEWSELYPALDVLAECRKALQWLKDNPSRRKTANGMARFIGNWLSRSQNNNRSPPSQQTSTADLLENAFRSAKK